MDATEIGICIGDNLMRKLSSEAEKIMIERFGKDTVIALATVEQEMPYVRNVNAYYEDGSGVVNICAVFKPTKLSSFC